MASPSSRRIHLGVNAKRFVTTLTDDRKMDFQKALVCLLSDPEPDGYPKISIDGFPYQPGTNAFASLGFIMTYRVRDDTGVAIGAVRLR